MRYSNLPGIAKRASVICMGTAQMGASQPEAEAWRILDKYVELGGNFIDTARVYGLTDEGVSLSEKCVGGWLKSRGGRDKLLLATKGGHYDLKDHSRRLDRASVFGDCERSLRDLGVDFIDLYWLHRDDESRPVEEIMDTLNALIRKGCVGALGASNWQPERLDAANAYARANGLAGFSADQPQWSLAKQFIVGDNTLVQMDDELFRFHERTKMPVVPYSSQAKGFYSKLSESGDKALGLSGLKPYAFDENIQKLSAVREIAQAHATTVGAVALAYLTSQEFPVFPIVGISRESYLDDVRRAGDLALTPQEVERLYNA